MASAKEPARIAEVEVVLANLNEPVILDTEGDFCYIAAITANGVAPLSTANIQFQFDDGSPIHYLCKAQVPQLFRLFEGRNAEYFHKIKVTAVSPAPSGIGAVITTPARIRLWIGTHVTIGTHGAFNV